MKIAELVERLKKEKAWLVWVDSSEVFLSRIFNKREIVFSLRIVPKGIEIHHPRYLFVGRISHFSSVEKDIRLSLNKRLLILVVCMLRHTGIWPLIVNKNFLTVNESNKHADIHSIKKELEHLLWN